MQYPHAFHVTFGTYMSRPPGSARPHIDKDHNQYGEPFAPTDPEKERWARENAREEPVSLRLEQRKRAEEAIADLAKRYVWIIYAICANFDHVHLVIFAEREEQNSAMRSRQSPANGSISSSKNAPGGQRAGRPSICGSGPILRMRLRT